MTEGYFGDAGGAGYISDSNEFGQGSTLRNVELDHRCDRCGHTLRQHASAALGTICMVGHERGKRRAYGGFCPCDGFFVEQPKPDE